ncbi:hypothetical protein KUTeg_016155 [Tegillarca granosa]|uniref:palmitoyl-protein hydrolase n=1 Tax=Tegillarca granosa TaxID=220873 RepID=A0ABQ9EQC8_TEGGR|nr:hypothetical protein KUTeg_016155 [Tegillarca granosa]
MNYSSSCIVYNLDLYKCNWHGWAQAFKELGLKHIKYICPTAPITPVTLNGGMRMPSWFDIFGLGPDCEQDVAGIKKASDILKNFISEEEKQGIPSNRIMVGGFSQGGAVSLYTAFTLEKPLAGIIGLSTWMPLHKDFDDEKMKKTNTDIPMLQCHGNADPLVPFHWGERTSHLIKKFSKCHKFKNYQNMAHSSCQEEMDDVKNFLQEHLSLDSKV